MPTANPHTRTRPGRRFAVSAAVFVALLTPARGSAAVDLFPASGATGVPPDTPLRITFATPPYPGGRGLIRIIESTTNKIIESIDASLPTATRDIGGLPDYSYYPVIISGNTATIHPRTILEYDRDYHVTIDAGVFLPNPEIDQPAPWHFRTKSAPPAANTTRLTVAADGSGDFSTVQGALDFIPEGNTTPTTLVIRAGTYEEILFVTNKHAITLLGEDRQRTVITYANNANFNPSGGNPYAAGSDPSNASVRRGDSIYRRGVLLAHRVEDLVIANLTIRNTTPRGGSQAEAIILNGTTTARAIITRVDLYSFQDTLQINGQAYISDCYIEGDVDFMWGTGPSFFENCHCRSTRSDAYYTQIRNPGSNHGYVYLHCTFDGLSGVNGNFLSRIEPTRFPHSEMVLLDCVLTDAVGPAAWKLDQARDGSTGDASNIHFWEWNSHSPDGTPVDISQRHTVSRQLTSVADAATIAFYRDPSFVLGNGWNPRSAPILTARGD